MRITRIEIMAFIVLCLIIIFLDMIGLFSVYSESYSCSDERTNLILQSVGGIEDIDTGLLSGGTVYRKTLLFENGLILTLKEKNIKSPLILGNNYTYFNCLRKDKLLVIKFETRERFLE